MKLIITGYRKTFNYMRTCFVICNFLILLFLKEDCHAQTQEVKFKLLAGTSGISLGKVNSITRDRHGVMWFSDQTNNSIVSYDGTRMRRYQYDPKNPNSLGGPYPECVLADSSGIIWIGFYGMGLDRFDPQTNTFTHFRHQQNDQESLSHDTVSAILIDHLGNLWVGTNHGLDLLNQKTGKFLHYSQDPQVSTSLSCNKVRAIYEDHEGTLWIGTGLAYDINSDGGLNRFNRETGNFTRYLNDPKDPHSLINNKVRAIFEDSRGTFWVGTAGDGLHTMDRKTGLFERHLNNPAQPEQLSRPPVKNIVDHITFITEDATGDLWIGTLSNGLTRYDPVTQKMTPFNIKADKSSGYKDTTSWCASSSKDGLLWISTQEQNLYQVDIYRNIIPGYVTRRTRVEAICEGQGSSLWLGTDNGLQCINLKNGAGISFPNEPPGLKKLVIQDIFKDKQGNIWLGTLGGGLYTFNAETKKFTGFRHDRNNNESLSDDSVTRIYEDRELNLWVGTVNGGLDLLNRKTGKCIHHMHESQDTNSLSANLVISIIEDLSNNLWIGTVSGSVGGGINRLTRETGKFKHYLLDKNIYCTYQDKAGIIWAGAEDGLYRYNTTSDNFFLTSDETTGFIINQAGSIMSDKEDNLWIGSNSGIFMLNQKRDGIIHYGSENGLFKADNGADLTLAIYKGQDGKLFFGNGSGYYAFYPEKLSMNPATPKIYFTNFWLNGKVVQPVPGGLLNEPLSLTKEIHFSYDENVFSFGFAVIDYSNATYKTFFFKLENYDQQWRKLGTEDKVDYFNVPPGKYIFRVKAINSTNGTWAEKEILVIISPPWWNTWWAYILFALLFTGTVWGFIYYRSNSLIKEKRILEHKVNERTREVMQQKEEIAAQRDSLEKTLKDLKTTQTQLIQSEKMASLGELTAGIAHEIQNPLNFVNNFSEVNAELLSEMKTEIDKGNFKEVKTIADDVIENEQKISHHGKRADAIVRGMLQHSRKSSGQNELTDINALADEYLRLSYHGLRAKDKSFNATLQTDFDGTLGKINIIPQNIGRVLLNLYNNAFYAVTQKRNELNGIYEPTVSVSTKKVDNKIEIHIKDNGKGIPQKIRDKIFQPFFTTKPTGQGTGLGLSLSYDIIKAHGGEIKVETKEGEYTNLLFNYPYKIL